MKTLFPTFLGHEFAKITQTLRHIIGNLYALGAPAEYRHAAIRHTPVLNLACNRLNHLSQRLTRLTARFLAGTLKPEAPLPVREPKPREKPTPKPKPAPHPIYDTQYGLSDATGYPTALRCPTRKSWLVRILQPTAQVSGQYEAILATPEAEALMEIAPRAMGRIIRPLARMLCFPLPKALQLPPRPRKPRPKKEKWVADPSLFPRAWTCPTNTIPLKQRMQIPNINARANARWRRT